MSRYYTGNPVETMHQALQYYYVNRFDSDTDKAQVAELIGGIGISEAADTKRVQLVEEPSKEAPPITTQSKLHLQAQVPFYHHLVRQKGVDRGEALEALAGDGSPEAWTIREKALNEGLPLGPLAISLAGLSCSRSFAMREEIEKKIAPPYGDLLLSLAGVDGETADQSRLRYYKQAEKACFIRELVDSNSDTGIMGKAAVSLIGQESPAADELRALIGRNMQKFTKAFAYLYSPKQLKDGGLHFGERALSALFMPIALPATTYSNHREAKIALTLSD